METVRSAALDSWVVGLVGTRTERFRRVTLTAEDVAGLAIAAAARSYQGDGRMLRLALQAHALGIAYEFDPYSASPFRGWIRCRSMRPSRGARLEPARGRLRTSAKAAHRALSAGRRRRRRQDHHWPASWCANSSCAVSSSGCWCRGCYRVGVLANGERLLPVDLAFAHTQEPEMEVRTNAP